MNILITEELKRELLRSYGDICTNYIINTNPNEEMRLYTI